MEIVLKQDFLGELWFNQKLQFYNKKIIYKQEFIFIKMISLVTITRNREAFIPLLNQNYERVKNHNVEWIILDDSLNNNKELYPEDATYIHLSQEDVQKYLKLAFERSNQDESWSNWYKYHSKLGYLPIGIKRNIANTFCTGEIIMHFDDDDYYLEDSVKIRMMALKPTNCVFCPKMVGYNTVTKEFINIGSDNTIFEGSLTYYKDDWKEHKFNNMATTDEGVEFIQKLPDYKRIKSDQIMIALIHNHNTKLFNTRDLVKDFKPPWESLELELGSSNKQEMWIIEDIFKNQKNLNYLVINPEVNITETYDQHEWKGIYIGSDTGHKNFKSKDSRKVVDILKKNNFPKHINLVYIKKRDTVILDLLKKKYKIDVLISDFSGNNDFKNRIRTYIKNEKMLCARKFEDQDWFVSL
jgi:hypothetical protein